MSKSNVSHVYSGEYKKVKISSDDNLSSEKVLNMRNIVILINPLSANPRKWSKKLKQFVGCC